MANKLAFIAGLCFLIAMFHVITGDKIIGNIWMVTSVVFWMWLANKVEGGDEHGK